MSNIAAAIKILSGQEGVKVFSIEAIVLEVNLEKRTCLCEAVSGKVQFNVPDVRLMAVIDDGLLLVPALDSNVVIIISNNEDPYIAQYSELDQIVMRGGEFSGLVKVVELTSKLNKIELKINSLVSNYNSHTHSANNTPTIKLEVGNLALTKQTEIENKNITHG